MSEAWFSTFTDEEVEHVVDALEKHLPSLYGRPYGVVESLLEIARRQHESNERMAGRAS